MVWSAAQRAAVRRHAEEGYPNEICGLLIGGRAGGEKVVREVMPVENAWEQLDEQRRRFLISPAVLMREERRLRGTGQEILGFYHSHPDHEARPSETDREFAWPSYSYVIQAVREARAVAVASWTLRNDRSGYDEETIVEVTNDDEERG